MSKKRIALITTWFSPNNGVAVNRMNAFAKYLGNDFDVEVFTQGEKEWSKNTDFGAVHYLTSKSFRSAIKHKSSDNKILHYFKTALNIFANKLNISTYSKWKQKVGVLFEKIHQSNKFDLIISSYAPVEPHEIAFQLKKKFPELFWLADMRDEMSKNPFQSEGLKNQMKKKEIEIASEIDALITVSKPILEGFKTIFPNVKYFEEVRNGFDHDLVPLKGFNDSFTVVYAGTFYGLIKPDRFFKILIKLIKEGQIDSDLELIFVGTSKNFSIPPELLDRVKFIPKVPYLEALEYVRNADCNLLVGPPYEAKGRFTGKLFDYLSVEKPILALIDTEDVGADLINEFNGGFVAGFYDEEASRNAVLEVYNLWKTKSRLEIDSFKTQELHRKHQVEKLKKIINNMLEQ